MSLLSAAFVIVLVAIAVFCVGGAVWSWPRLAGPGVRAVLGRLGVLAQLYSDWSELLGTASAQATTTSS